MAEQSDKKSCEHCTRQRVPITLRDFFWQDPFFSSNWEDFHKLHDEMMRETRAVWQKFDDQLKHLEAAKTPEPLTSEITPPGWLKPRAFMRLPSIFNEERSKDLFKDDQQIALRDDNKGFEVSLDTSHYRPDEIKVNVDADNVLTVEANHEEKAEDGSKHISRRFMRKYTLPAGCKADTVTSNLSSDGVLMISAPKLALEGPKSVPIKHVQ